MSLAGAIAGSIQDGRSVVLKGTGASAVKHAVSAFCIARNFVSVDGPDVICAPEFIDIDLAGNEQTAVRLHVD